MKVTVVGAGMAGCVVASELHKKGHDVEIYETRPHFGGNCYDMLVGDVLVHKYGPHIFHTKSQRIWDWIHQYTTFNNYHHQVWANTKLGQIPVPFNTTSAELVGELTGEQIRELIFEDYSAKMWGMPFNKLPKSITDRVPKKRDSRDPRYFITEYQGIPDKGYTEMFTNMLGSTVGLGSVHLGCATDAWRKAKHDLVVYTGPIDAYYDYGFGRLGYRTLDIKILKNKPKQPVAVINECNNLPYTRTSDHSFWLGQNVDKTVWTREYPRECGEKDTPYYPKQFGDNPRLYKLYADLVPSIPTVFVGRLATYKYYNMDQVIAQALKVAEDIT